MPLWQSLTRKLPLTDDRDVMARVGSRFIWCTLPYFAFALGLAAFGQTDLLLTPASIVMLIVPIAGGLLDWRRVHAR